jgi:uncharacterized membrane protein YgdD (TMEM256/DUF423 family)
MKPHANKIYQLTAIASLSGLLAVIILALASHTLPKIIDSSKVSTITISSQIQLFNAILVISSYNLTTISDKIKFNLALKLILFGSLIFSFSIYLLSLKEFLGLPQLKVFGPITPLGGIILIAGWALLTLRFFQLGFKKID